MVDAQYLGVVKAFRSQGLSKLAVMWKLFKVYMKIAIVISNVQLINIVRKTKMVEDGSFVCPRCSGSRVILIKK